MTIPKRPLDDVNEVAKGMMTRISHNIMSNLEGVHQLVINTILLTEIILVLSRIKGGFANLRLKLISQNHAIVWVRTEG